MTLLEIKNKLQNLNSITFTLPDGSLVPNHFHVTEVGKIAKHFVDCGGVLRQEKKVNFQLWNANDYDHRLHPDKLLKIIELSDEIFNFGDLEIEVEYQGANTIEKFGVEFKNNSFHLTSLKTDCLAKENCGIPQSKQKVKLSELNTENSCAPDSGCC